MHLATVAINIIYNLMIYAFLLAILRSSSAQIPHLKRKKSETRQTGYVLLVSL